MFYVRLNKVRIIKNGELLGKAEVQLISFINHSETDFPSIEKIFSSTDEELKKDIIKEALKTVIQSRVLMPIHRIKDNSTITFGDSGYIVYESKEIPEDLSWQILAIEKDSKTRDTAALVEKIVTDKNVESVLSDITKLTSLSNPIATAIASIFNVVAKSIVGFSKEDRDDQIGYFLASFIRAADYQHGERSRQDVVDLTGNMFVDYTFFGFENQPEQ